MKNLTSKWASMKGADYDMQFYDVAAEQDNEPPSPSFSYTAHLAHGMHLSMQCYLLTHGDSAVSEMGKVTVGVTQRV